MRTISRQAKGKRTSVDWGTTASSLGPQAAVQAAQPAVPDRDSAALGGQQTGEGVQQGGFAAAVGSQDAHELPGLNLEIQVRQDRPVFITQMEVLYSDHHIPLERRDLSR